MILFLSLSLSLHLPLCLFLCSCIGSRIVLDLQRFFEILDSIFGGCTPPLVTALASRGHLGGFHLSPAASQEILHCSLEILRTRRGLWWGSICGFPDAVLTGLWYSSTLPFGGIFRTAAMTRAIASDRHWNAAVEVAIGSRDVNLWMTRLVECLACWHDGFDWWMKLDETPRSEPAMKWREEGATGGKEGPSLQSASESSQ